MASTAGSASGGPNFLKTCNDGAVEQFIAGCLYRKLNSTIMVVKATDDRLRCDAAFVLDGTMDWSVFAKRSMSSQLVVVGSILRQDPA